MRVVIDTSLFITVFSSRSANHWVWQSLLRQDFALCVTTDILEEYEEIILRETNPAFAEAVMDALLSLPNLVFVTKYFYWELLHADPDDNKFVDCAIAANARYLVSDDRHFRVLNKIPFPKIEVVKVIEFKRIILARK